MHWTARAKLWFIKPQQALDKCWKYTKFNTHTLFRTMPSEVASVKLLGFHLVPKLSLGIPLGNVCTRLSQTLPRYIFWESSWHSLPDSYLLVLYHTLFYIHITVKIVLFLGVTHRPSEICGMLAYCRCSYQGHLTNKAISKLVRGYFNAFIELA